MKEVYPNLFVGSESDIFEFAHIVQAIENPEHPSYFLIHAAKEPYHRKELGYTTRGAPKDHPEYLFARREQRLILNLVDVPESKAKFIPDSCLDEAVHVIHWWCDEVKKPLFIHCNEGKSRAPSIVLMFLIEHTDFAAGLNTFESVENKFKGLYPDYQPNGVRLKTKERFERRYKNDQTKT